MNISGFLTIADECKNMQYKELSVWVFYDLWSL